MPPALLIKVSIGRSPAAARNSFSGAGKMPQDLALAITSIDYAQNRKPAPTSKKRGSKLAGATAGPKKKRVKTVRGRENRQTCR